MYRRGATRPRRAIYDAINQNPEAANAALEAEAEREQSEENESLQLLRAARSYDSWLIAFILFVIIGILGSITIIIVTKGTGGVNERTAKTQQGPFGASVGNAGTPIIDDFGIAILNNTLLRISEDCIPTPGSALDTLFQDELQPGASRDNAKLTELFGELRTTLGGKCNFYGLETVEFRTNKTVGPADLCHGYMHVALDIFFIYFDGEKPVNTQSLLEAAYDAAWPLNLFWGYMRQTRQGVIQYFNFILDQAIATPANFEIKDFATAFCNQYFADDVGGTYYDSSKQPWLGSPFPGELSRLTNNKMADLVKDLLSDISFGTEFAMKKIIVVGDAIDKSPGALLFIQSVFGGVPIELLPSSAIEIAADVQNTVEALRLDSGNFDGDKVPIFIMSRFGQDPASQLSFKQYESQVLYGITDAIDASRTPYPNIAFNLSRHPSAPNAVSTLDFTTSMTYESTFGLSYIREKDVAEIINIIIADQTPLEFQNTSVLAETFALKNTQVDGDDLGNRLAVQAAKQELLDVGISLGFGLLAPELQLQETNQVDVVFGAAPLPSKFDWRTEKPACMGPIINQGKCQCCWAVGYSYMLGARACISGLTNGYFPTSVQHVTSCSDTGRQGCAQGHPQDAFTFTSTLGAVDSTCFPFKNAGSAYEVPCERKCNTQDPSAMFSQITAISTSWRRLHGSEVIKRDLVDNGPLSIGFNTPSDMTGFFTSSFTKKQIYDTKFSQGIGGHLVLLVGYDDTTNPKHWILQNSYGTSYGDGGYMKIAQDLKIFQRSTFWLEDNAYVARPQAIRSFGANDVLPETTATDPQLLINEARAVEASSVRVSSNTPTVGPVFFVVLFNIILLLSYLFLF